MRSFRRFIVRPLLVLFALSVLQVLFIKVYEPPFTGHMLGRAWDQFRNDRPVTMKTRWRQIEDLDPKVPAIAVLATDPLFIGNFGMPQGLLAEVQAMYALGRDPELPMGLTHLVANRVFAAPGPGWLNRWMTAYYALLIEWTWDPKRTVEVYLNTLEVADGWYGLEAGSQLYYAKPANTLRPEEAAALLVAARAPRMTALRISTSPVKREARRLTRAATKVPTAWVNPQLGHPMAPADPATH